MTRLKRNLVASAATAGLMAATVLGVSTVASAQQDQPSGQEQMQRAPSGQQQEQQGAGQPASGAQMSVDRVIASVDGQEIRQSDVVDAIQGLPPQIRQMPAQMLLPVVVDQLLLRELILAEGYAERLQEDPDVLAIIQPASDAAEEDAIVQVWLQRALRERVTEDAVNEAFLRLQSANPDVTLEQVRPQIEQDLEQQAILDIRSELRGGADVVLFDATGQPVDVSDAAAADAGMGADQRQDDQPTRQQAQADTGGDNDGGDDAYLPGLPYGEIAMGTPHVLQVESSPLHGEYLVDGNGMPIYMFEMDTRGRDQSAPMSLCFDDCEDIWPPLLVSDVQAEGDADPSLASTFERRNGEVQATYNGWPLYYYVQDDPGAAPRGQDRQGFGGEWYLIGPDGSPIHD